MDTLRDAPLGQLVRQFWTPNSLRYPEEKAGFEIPAGLKPKPVNEDIEKGSDNDQQSEGHAEKAAPDGVILVDWYGADDPENPQNFSVGKRAWITFVLFWMTFAVYGVSSMYTPSEQGVMQAFGVGVPKAALGLALYVLGAGLGPMLFSPLSEVPALGRNIPYIIPTTLFLILSIPTAVVNNYSALMALRFLTGFVGSPAVGTGPASIQDIYPFHILPLGLTVWMIAAFTAPAFSPTLSAFAVMNEDWHWSLWVIVWITAPALVLMWLALPETSAPKILLRRAQRLRKLTGQKNFKSQSEIRQANLAVGSVLRDALLKPIEISCLDPAIMFAHLYIMYIYGTYYSFFEAFPIVYAGSYGFNLGEVGLSFIPIAVGTFIGAGIFVLYMGMYVKPVYMKKGPQPQEFNLIAGLYGSFALPVGLFIFAWTARASIHWIVPMIGNAIFAGGAFLIFIAVFLYLPMSYPQYAASLFAANDLFRSCFAAGAVIFAHPMFVNLGIGKGVSVLGGLGVGGVIGIWLLWCFGAALRARSRFALSQ
ncbi:hypothetical protein M409DRAFT_35229 [Zasmidium cellare ATCC 36951]|uniref:Major facilitator superfamily (MFS) profile domain-containing protein n=1 Tax=Zasmidium cellare ATCC 36951 TaxID=1080233 RepID=A0A6A6D411_ZASCE|nr:uncharacterized protein M409DRAFT_35229 [Zasmidium cellare ATCC 36951]KAF2174127.1 hypothetical protein M409DRAFT_35229 [Zasmidium cellare ATCC 36951]